MARVCNQWSHINFVLAGGLSPKSTWSPQVSYPLSDIFRWQSCSHTWAFELHCDIVDINRVGDINILTIIVFTSEVFNGALGGIDRHYKCGHIIATLHSNVTVDDLGDIYVYLRRHS
jgi:hypothetical protein